MQRVVVAIVITIATVVTAHAETCEEEAATLRTHLTSEASRAKKWNVIWGVLFGAAAAGQLGFALAEVDPLGGDFDDDTRETLYVGTVKATLALGSKVVLPLRIPVPDPTADACTDVKSLRLALGEAARREKRSFWLTHIGGTAVNLAGATILTIRRSFKVGAISFAISYPIGPASAYTQPRRSWKLYRAQSVTWTVGASSTGDSAQLWLGGQW